MNTEECKYGIVAVSRGQGKLNVHHLILYPKPFHPDEVKRVSHELNTDEEFGLVGRIGKDVRMVVVSGESLEFIRECFVNGQNVISKEQIGNEIEKRREL